MHPEYLSGVFCVVSFLSACCSSTIELYWLNLLTQPFSTLFYNRLRTRTNGATREVYRAGGSHRILRIASFPGFVLRFFLSLTFYNLSPPTPCKRRQVFRLIFVVAPTLLRGSSLNPLHVFDILLCFYSIVLYTILGHALTKRDNSATGQGQWRTGAGVCNVKWIGELECINFDRSSGVGAEQIAKWLSLKRRAS